MTYRQRYPGGVAYGDAVAQFRRAFLSHHLDAHGWNVTQTARALGLGPSYLFKLVREFGLKRP